jgi:hypothetical protein
VKWQAGEFAQRPDAEGGHTVAGLVKGDEFSRRQGGQLRKLLSAEADGQRKQRRTAKTRQAEGHDAFDFAARMRHHLKGRDQHDRKSGIDPRHGSLGGHRRKQNPSDRHHPPERRERKGRPPGGQTALAGQIRSGPVAVQRLSNSVEENGCGKEPESPWQTLSTRGVCHVTN